MYLPEIIITKKQTAAGQGAHGKPFIFLGGLPSLKGIV
jgi:hypothetical protein